MSPKFTLDPKLIPVGWDKFGPDHIWFSQVDVYLTYHKKGVLLSSFGLGPSMNYGWEKWDGYPRVNAGMAGYLSFAADKVRITVGLRSFRENFKGDNIYFNLGLTDFQGIVHALKESML